MHFKSKLLTFPGGRFAPHDEGERARFAAYARYRRSAEASTVRGAATDLLTGHPQRAVIVLGDLDDEVEAATAQILTEPPGSEIGTTGFDRPDTGDAERPWFLAPRIPAAAHSVDELRGSLHELLLAAHRQTGEYKIPR